MTTVNGGNKDAVYTYYYFYYYDHRAEGKRAHKILWLCVASRQSLCRGGRPKQTIKTYDRSCAVGYDRGDGGTQRHLSVAACSAAKKTND